MDVIELLRSGEAKLPEKRSERDFEDRLAGILDAYLGQIAAMNSGDAISSRVMSAEKEIRGLCECVRGAIGRHLQGLQNEAYRELSEGIGKIRQHIGRLYTLADVSSAVSQHLYRVRRGTMQSFSKSELFHIPFEERYKVRTQRYSIPGLPCLYLGGSIWVCWEELARPPFHEMQISRFEAAGPIKLLDFGYRPGVIASMAEKVLETEPEGASADFVVSYAVCWPLIAAC